MDEKQLDALATQVADKLSIQGTLRELFTTATAADLEVISTQMAAYMWDATRFRNLPDAKRNNPLRILVNDADVNTDGSGATLADYIGHTGPTLPDIINFNGFTGSLEPGDGRQLNLFGGGGGLACYDYTVAECWADEVAAGRGTEGQTVTLFVGCTTKVYSTLKGAVDAIGASASVTQPSVAICPGTYTESTISWPSISASPEGITLIGLGGVPSQNATAPGVILTTSSGVLIQFGSNPIDINASSIVFRAFPAQKSFTMSGASSGPSGQFVGCRFDNDIEADFNKAFFTRCYFENDYIPSASHAPEHVVFTDCYFNGASIDTSLVINQDELIVHGCRFLGGTSSKVIIGDVSDVTITGNSFSATGTSSDRILMTTATGAAMRLVIAGNTFNNAPPSGAATIRLQPSSNNDVSGVVIANNTFRGTNGSAVSSSTAHIKLIGDADSRIDNVVVVGNSFGGDASADSGYIEDDGGFSVIGDFVFRSVFGPNGPAQKVRYSLTNSSDNQFDSVAVDSGAPSYAAHESALYFDTTANSMYVNTDGGTTWAVLGVAGGGGAAPSPHGLVSAHHDNEADYTATLGLLGLGVSTGDLTMYSDAGTTVKGTWDGALGLLRAGDSTPPDSTGMVVAGGTLNGTDIGSSFAAFKASSVLIFNASYAQQLWGFRPDVSITSTAAGTHTLSGIIAGLQGGITVLKGSATAMVASDVRSLWATAIAANAGVTITDRYGVYVSNATGSGAVTTQYGLYLENMTKGGTDWAIYSLGGVSSHLGAMRFGSNTAPTNVTNGDLTATRLIVPDAAILHGAITQLGGPVVIPGDGALLFSDNTNYVGLRVPATPQANNYIYELPDDDPTDGQVLAVKSIAGTPIITTEWITPSGSAAWPVVTNDTELTIATGAITVTQDHHTVDTEADAASDELDTINGLTANNLYLLRPADDARSVVIKHETGNIHVAHSNADLTLENSEDWVLVFSPDGTNAYVLGGGGSGSASPLTTKGDLYTFTTVDARLAVGANDTILMADSGEATGLRWQAPATTEIADVAAAESAGTSDTWARGDHVHALGAKFIWMAIAHWFIGGPLFADTTNHQGAVIPLPNGASSAVLIEGSSIQANVASAATGASILLDIKHSTTVEGSQTSIFDGSNYPTIAATDTHVADTSSNDGTIDTSPDYTSIDGGWLRLYVRQVGSTVRGYDLTVTVFAKVFVE